MYCVNLYYTSIYKSFYCKIIITCNNVYYYYKLINNDILLQCNIVASSTFSTMYALYAAVLAVALHQYSADYVNSLSEFGKCKDFARLKEQFDKNLVSKHFICITSITFCYCLFLDAYIIYLIYVPSYMKI